jgi:hypothetical protein
MSDEQAQLILSPSKYEAHTTGSVIVTADCGHDCYISQGGIQTQARLNARTICMDCVDPDAVPEVEVTPEIFADLVANLGYEKANRLVELSKDPKIRQALFGPRSLPAEFHRLHGTS